MFRAVLLAALVVVGCGTVLAVTPQASDVPQQSVSVAVDGSRTQTNGTEFSARATQYEIDAGENETLRIDVTGAPSGTPVKLSLASPPDGYSGAALVTMTDGRYVGDGVRRTVSDDGTISVTFPPWTGCHNGRLSFVLQRLDTGVTAEASVDVVREDELDAWFERRTYTVAAGEVARVDASITCAPATLRINDTDGPYSASVSVDDGDDSLPFWLDTAHPANASKLFRTEATATRTNASVSRPPATLSGRYRLTLLSAGDELATAPLRVREESADTTNQSTTTDSGTADVVSSETTTSGTGTTDVGRTTGEPTPAGKSPSTESTVAPTTDRDQSAPSDTATTGPGFGVATAVVALIALTLAASRRRS